IDDGDLRRLLERVQTGDFRHPRLVNPNVPRTLEAICLKAMARRREDRYASARLLAEDVERWLADEPIPGFREPWGLRLSRWERRHRGLVRGGSLALALVTLVALGAAGLVSASRQAERIQRIEAIEQKGIAEDQRRKAEARSRELQRR